MDDELLESTPMARLQQIPTWLTTLLIAVTLLLAVRITSAIDADLAGDAVLRTYAFWAAVCIPVAYLGDIVVRTVLEYRIVRMAVARVRSRR